MGGTKARAAFVGRGPELELTAAALARTAHGVGVSVICVGEAGIGKTRLALEIAEQARSSGFAVLSGGCIEMGQAGLPYGPFAEALRGAVASGTLDPADLRASTREQLAILVPDIADPDVEVDAGFDLAGLGQIRLFEAVVAALESIRRDRPVLLVVEDLHWADRSTLDLLTFLVRNLADTATMVVATARGEGIDRDEPIAATLAELGRRPSVERIDLGPLGLVETMQHLLAVLGSQPDLALTRQIHQRSDGNPFFIEALARAYLDGESASVPASLRDILLAELSRQPPNVQRLMAACAIAGPQADDHLLAAILATEPDDIVEPLRLAVRSGSLVRTRTDDGETYGFRHALLAEATAADLLHGERRRLHASCADALAARRPDDGTALAQWATRVAHHREQAGDLAGTVAASIEAAVATEAVSAHRDALAQYERAIRLLPHLSAPTVWADWDRSELYLRAAHCAALVGEVDVAARHSQTALASLPTDADAWRRGRVALAVGEYLWIAGDADFADALVLAADVIPSDPPTPERAEALASLGIHHQLFHRSDLARQALEEAIETAIAADAPRPEAQARVFLVTTLMEDGDPDGAFEQIELALAAIRRAPPRPDSSVVYMNIASVSGWCGRDADCVRISLEGLDVAQRLGCASYYGGALAAAATESLDALGRLREAVDLLDGTASTSAGGYAETTRMISEALVRTHLGEFDRARACLDLAADWPVDGDAAMLRYLAAVEVELAVQMGDPGGAIERLRAGLAIPTAHVPDLDLRTWMHCLGVRAAADLAERARAARDAVAASAAVAVARGFVDDACRETAASPPGPARTPMRARADAALTMAEAELARAEGHPDPARWADAAAAWAALAYALRPIYADLRQAEARLLLGRDARADAVTLLTAAHEAAVRTEARPLQLLAEGIARRARVALPTRPVVASVDATDTVADPAERLGLTERESEILALLAEGLTNRQIGERLFISPKTAGVHVSNILGKLEVPSRIQAATIAHRLGLGQDAGSPT